MSIPTNKQLKQVRYNGAVIPLVNPSVGTLPITTNGEHDVTQYAKVNVNVQGGITPTGTITITANGTYNVTDKASAVVNVPIPAHSGSVSIGSATQSTITIDLGFAGCKYFAIMANNKPVDTNTCDVMAWNGTTNYSVWSRYRGSYNQAYGADSGTVTVSGNSITITAGTNLAFCRKTTYKWIAM